MFKLSYGTLAIAVSVNEKTIYTTRPRMVKQFGYDVICTTDNLLQSIAEDITDNYNLLSTEDMVRFENR
jgi:hypothetical protein